MPARRWNRLILACGDVDSWAPSSVCGQGTDIPLYFRAFLQLDVSEGRTQHESASASFGISRGLKVSAARRCRSAWRRRREGNALANTVPECEASNFRTPIIFITAYPKDAAFPSGEKGGRLLCSAFAFPRLNCSRREVLKLVSPTPSFSQLGGKPGRTEAPTLSRIGKRLSQQQCRCGFG